MSNDRLRSAVLAVALVVPAAVYGQERRQGGPPPYDLASEKTITATMVRTDAITPPGRDPMMYLTVTADGKTLHVILAPVDWMKKQKFAFKAGDQVDVTGIPGLHLNSEPAMMGRKLKSGTHTLAVRDESGKPLWEAPQPERERVAVGPRAQ